jgi:hypothetical protein
MAGGRACWTSVISSDARVGYQHFRVFVRGVPCLNRGRRPEAGRITSFGSSPAAALPPVMHENVGAAGPIYAGTCASCTSRTMAQMKAAISRAIAVTATVGFFPFAVRVR